MLSGDKWLCTQLQWEDIIPPPFLLPWRKFISLLQSNGTGSKGFDDTIKQLIPMFNGSQIRLPIRTLKEREVLQLSGLDGLWSHTSLDDAERLPKRSFVITAGTVSTLTLSAAPWAVTNAFKSGLTMLAKGVRVKLQVEIQSFKSTHICVKR